MPPSLCIISQQTLHTQISDRTCVDVCTLKYVLRKDSHKGFSCLLRLNLPGDLPFLFTGGKKISPAIIRSGVFILSDQPWGQQSWEPVLLYSGQSQCPLTCGWPLARRTSDLLCVNPHPSSLSSLHSFQSALHLHNLQRHLSTALSLGEGPRAPFKKKKFRAWLRMEKWVIVIFSVNPTTLFERSLWLRGSWRKRVGINGFLNKLLMFMITCMASWTNC